MPYMMGGFPTLDVSAQGAANLPQSPVKIGCCTTSFDGRLPTRPNVCERGRRDTKYRFEFGCECGGR